MAESPAHKFGQIIGNILEEAIEARLKKFAERHKLFLDQKGDRPARKGKKVSWKDRYGNYHDLDYVLEQAGTPQKIGIPLAFIEVAWRRYTKHSRNKAQEIQGAILPLVDTYRGAAPFIGVVLAGVFTKGSLKQLQSRGFSILYFPYETVIEAFKVVGIDAHFEEETPEGELKEKARIWAELDDKERSRVACRLVKLNSKEMRVFMESLEIIVKRKIELVRVLPLHGVATSLDSVQKAIDYIEKYDEDNCSNIFVRYEVEVRYSNGDCIQGQFTGKASTIDFLRLYLSY